MKKLIGTKYTQSTLLDMTVTVGKMPIENLVKKL